MESRAFARLPGASILSARRSSIRDIKPMPRPPSSIEHSKPGIQRRLLAAAIALPLALLNAADITGVWALAFELNGNQRQSYRGECTLEQQGDRITGSCLSGYESLVAIKGRVQDRTITFQFTTGVDQGTTVVFNGALDEAETAISGSVQFIDAGGERGEGTFTATKR